MPFLTEELWQKTGEVGPARDAMLMLSEWPRYTGLVDAQADAEMDWVIRLITEVRSVRAEMNVPAGAKIPLVLKGVNSGTEERLARHSGLLCRMARLSDISIGAELPEGSLQFVINEATGGLPIADVIDLSAEKERLQKAMAKLDGEIKKIDGKLGNEKFISKAPQTVIDEQRERKTTAEAEKNKLADALAKLQAAG